MAAAGTGMLSTPPSPFLSTTLSPTYVLLARCPTASQFFQFGDLRVVLVVATCVGRVQWSALIRHPHPLFHNAFLMVYVVMSMKYLDFVHGDPGGRENNA